jgi:excinuclease UvrABC nuclease subunit
MSISTWSRCYRPYNETEVKKIAPTSTGVYALWVKYKEKGWVCFYVGKANNIESRLLDHLSNDEDNECIKEDVKYRCAFCWIEITTADERSGAEKYLYDTIKPECNQNDPGGNPRKIPLPPSPSE